MSKLISLKELLEMDSDEFNSTINLLREEDKKEGKKKDDGDLTATDLVKLYLGGKITKSALAAGVGAGGVGAAMTAGKAIAGIAGAALIGTALGYGINRLISDDFEGEALERVNKSLKDLNYAKAELDVYCRGAGKLCQTTVRCLPQKDRGEWVEVKGKRSKTFVPRYGGNAVGGYQYERKEGLGIGDGREKTTAMAAKGWGDIPGAGAMAQKLGPTWGGKIYDQTPGFDARDGAVIAAIGNAIVWKDVLDGRADYDAKTGKLKLGSDAEILKYQACLKEILGSGFIQKTLANYPFVKKHYDMLQKALGLKPFVELEKIATRPTKPKDEKEKAAPVVTPKETCNELPMSVGCKGTQPSTMLAIMLRATEFGQAAFQKNEKKFEDMYNAQTYTEEMRDFIEQALRSVDSEVADLFKQKQGKIERLDDIDRLFYSLAKGSKLLEQIYAKDLRKLIAEAFDEILQEELLTEGGAGGHMRHPFDIMDVKTGADLVKKFEQIASEIQGGNLPDTKIDGVNTSIKVVNGDQFAMDRGSSKPIDVEGITIDRLPERFKPDPNSGREHGMVKAGQNVLGIFNAALEDIKPELAELGMLDDPTKFFNMEYVKGTTNVLAYDHDFIKIHGVNQFYEKSDRRGNPVRPGLERPINPETNKPIKDPSVPVAYDQEVMDRLVEKLNKHSDEFGFKIYSAIPSKITGDIDFSSALQAKVPVTYSKGDVKDAILADRLKTAINRIGEKVTTKDGRKPPAQGKEIYKAVLGASAADTNADPERQTPLNDLLETGEDYEKAIDGAVFWHATRLLGNAIIEAMEVDHPAVKGAASEHEGLVVRLQGDDFDTKITGEFILGGEASTFRDETPKKEQGKNIAIFPGSFKPPHKGHLSVIENIAASPNVDEIKVLISAPSKRVRSPKITPEKAKAVFEKYINASNISKPISIEVSSHPSPIGAAYEYIGKLAGPNENIYLLTSKADAARFPKEVMEKAKSENKNAATISVDSMVLPVCRDEGCETANKVSATTIRDIVDSHPDVTLEQLQVALNHMPDYLSTADKIATLEMLVDASLSDKFSSEELTNLSESVTFIMETIEKALDIVLLTEKVRKTKGKKEWCVVSKKKKTKEGKLRKYGCYKSKKAANRRLGQVEGFKARAMKEGEELEEFQIVEVSTMAGGSVQGYGGNPFKDVEDDNYRNLARIKIASPNGIGVGS